jgi:hypothetical protein
MSALVAKDARSDAILKLRERMLHVADYTKDNRDVLHQFVSSAGVTLVGVVLRVMPPKDTVWCRSICVLVVEAQQEETPEEMYDGPDSVLLPVAEQSSEKDAKRTAPHNAGSAPATHRLTSLHSYWILVDKLMAKNVESGNLAIFHGVRAKQTAPSPAAAASGKKYDSNVLLTASSIEVVPDADASVLLRQSQATLASTPLRKCALDFDGGDKSQRYDRSAIVVVDVCASTDDDALMRACSHADGRVYRMEIEDDGKNWWYKGDGARAKAQIYYAAQQWKGAFEDGRIETVMVSAVLFDDLLHPFRISDVQKWERMAPNLWRHLDHVLIAEVDIKATNGNVINQAVDDPVYAFALALRGTCLVADIPALYRKIGILVSPEWVGKTFAQQAQHVDDFHPSAVINVTEEPSLAGKLMGGAAAGRTEFRVVLAIYVGEKLAADIARLSQVEGDELMGVLKYGDNHPHKLSDDHVVHQRLAPALRRDTLDMCVFALSTPQLTAAVAARRTEALQRFLPGGGARLALTGAADAAPMDTGDDGGGGGGDNNDDDDDNNNNEDDAAPAGGKKRRRRRDGGGSGSGSESEGGKQRRRSKKR